MTIYVAICYNGDKSRRTHCNHNYNSDCNSPLHRGTLQDH